MTLLTKPQELEMFAQLNANNPRFKEWLDQERAATVDTMTKARDPVTIHQYQGRAQLLEHISKMLAIANNVIRGV